MMSKEFLHTLVREREERSSLRIPEPRMTTPWPVPRANVRDGRLWTYVNPEPSNLLPIPEHMGIPPWARVHPPYTGVESPPLEGGVNGVFRVDTQGVPHIRERHFARTYLLIGNVPSEHWTGNFASFVGRHCLALITQHSCYPDYNVTNIIGASFNGSQYQAVTYRCAWCDAGFTLGA